MCQTIPLSYRIRKSSWGKRSSRIHLYLVTDQGHANHVLTLVLVCKNSGLSYQRFNEDFYRFSVQIAMRVNRTNN